MPTFLRPIAYALGCGMSIALACAGCSGGDAADNNAEADTERVPTDLRPRDLVGEWRLVSVDGPGRADIDCPARLFVDGFEISCDDDDTVTLGSGGAYEDTLSGLFSDGPHEGTWIASTQQRVIVIDDKDDEADPQAYRFEVEGDDLRIDRDFGVAEDERKISVSAEFTKVSP